jgi:hypothetical protein
MCNVRLEKEKLVDFPSFFLIYLPYDQAHGNHVLYPEPADMMIYEGILFYVIAVSTCNRAKHVDHTTRRSQA